jgi:uncharacterized protein YjiS (DUF1127 family)
MEEELVRLFRPSVFAGCLHALLRGARAIRKRRAECIALATLLDMDRHQLDDLGLNAGDILDAMKAPRLAHGLLADRRARRSTIWSAMRRPSA